MNIEYSNEIVLGSINALHLKNCKGTIRFNDPNDSKKLSSLSMYNCSFDKQCFQQFKCIEYLRLDILGKFKKNQWKFQSFESLKSIKIFAQSINLSLIELPSKVTSLSITSFKYEGKLNHKVIKQLKVLSLN